ncbi:hypothetical protein ACQEVF_22975 [Nonomuraea polychroma]|uniref:hypothetical protein n=1 Tax=Nonomuraea polychroma TaxID=46176 RepID=UPI003D8F0AF2
MRILMTGATGNVGLLVTAAPAESPSVQADVTAPAAAAGPVIACRSSAPVIGRSGTARSRNASNRWGWVRQCP